MRSDEHPSVANLVDDTHSQQTRDCSNGWFVVVLYRRPYSDHGGELDQKGGTQSL